MSVGLGTNWTPFIHYLDYINMVPYRYDKLFCGIYRMRKILEKKSSGTILYLYASTEGNGIKLVSLLSMKDFGDKTKSEGD